MKDNTAQLIAGFKRLRTINHGDFHRIRTLTAYRTGNSKGMRTFAKRFAKTTPA